MSVADVQASASTGTRVSAETRVGLGVAGTAVALGVLGDALLRSVPFGVNLALWTVALVLAVAALQRWTRADDVSYGWMPLALGIAALIAWRDSPTLKALDFAALGIILGLAMLRARGGAVRMAGLAHHAAGIAVSAGDAATGAARLLFRDVRWRELRSDGMARYGVSTLRGIAIAVPLLLVFGGLLVSADARFERLLGGLFGFDLPLLLNHVFVALVVAWLCGGVLRTMTAREEAAPGPQLRRPEGFFLGMVEAVIVLGLLDLLFLAFVAVQIPYFFGSAEVVTGPGSTSFAEYARRGFFELVAVAGLVLPLLLFADWIVRREGRSQGRVFRALAGAQVALLFVIMASALHRMRLYQQAYGLTELRLYTTAFMLWLGVVSVWFAWTVLRGHRERFAWGALTTALEALVILHVVNPDATIVRVNAARPDAAVRFDAAYAASLSADAVPPLLDALPSVRPEIACRGAERLRARWMGPEPDWRSWSLSRDRARRNVGRQADALRAMDTCPDSVAAPASTSPAPSTSSASASPAPGTSISASPTVPADAASPSTAIAPAATGIDPAADAGGEVYGVQGSTPSSSPVSAPGTEGRP